MNMKFDMGLCIADILSDCKTMEEVERKLQWIKTCSWIRELHGKSVDEIEARGYCWHEDWVTDRQWDFD